MKKVSIKNNRKKKKGFTLVELIIVIAIIAILAAMAIPKLSAVKMDAKVSNDVAAAKNIQTTAAILLANGTFEKGKNYTVSDSADVMKRLSGKYASIGETEAIKEGKFTIEIDANEDIVVKAAGYQLYPTDTDAGVKGRSDYAKKAQGTTETAKS